MHELAYTFPTDWDIKTIGDIACHIGSGATPTGGSTVYSKAGITFIRSQNVTLKGLLLDDVAFIEPRIHQQMARSEIFPYDVLLNITGASIGRCCFVPRGFGLANVNQHVCAIRLPKPSHEDAVFLSCVLASHIGQSQIDRLNAGGNRERLNYQQVRSFAVPWPRPDERKRIAAILEAVDAAITKTEAVIAKLRQVRAGLLHDLLTCGLDEHGQLRDPIAHPEQFQDSPLGRIPKEWEILTLRKLIEFISYGFTNPMPTTRVGPWMVTAFDIGDGAIKYEQARHTTKHAFDTLLTPKSKPCVGDILVTKDGTLGRVALVDQEDICINQSVAVLRPSAGTDAEFVARFLRSPHGQAAMLADVGGLTIKHIYISKLADLIVPYPQEAERKQACDVLHKIEAEIAVESNVYDKIQMIKSGLMTDLLTGRVRVPERVTVTS